MRYRIRRATPVTFYVHLVLTLLILVLACPLILLEQPTIKENRLAPVVTYAPITTTPIQDQLRIQMYDSGQGKVVEMLLDEYLVGVVAAEMPATYQMGALRAQAVAARTYCVKNKISSGCSAHEGADVCDQSNHCQAYASPEQRKTRWGDGFGANEEKIRYSVYSTQNEILTYQGQPITVLFHSTSGGMTEDVEHVFSQALPYLRSVESPGEEDSSKFHDDKSFTLKEAAQLLNERFQDAKVTADKLSGQLSIVKRYDSGRIEQIRVGGVTVSGVEVRRALGLNSANFTFTVSGGQITFHTVGYGHGVGMSQVGADAMAREGNTYAEILKYYYTGIELDEIWNYVK
ncbi:MAG: stage II sporulation protein D [Eubacteriales bacterium]|nr:stage II sporulation protein D [Eubacteriales bacterium]